MHLMLAYVQASAAVSVPAVSCACVSHLYDYHTQSCCWCAGINDLLSHVWLPKQLWKVLDIYDVCAHVTLYRRVDGHAVRYD